MLRSGLSGSERPSIQNNRNEAVQDLSTANKQNRGIKDAIFKSICHVQDIIPGPTIYDTILIPVDLSGIDQVLTKVAQGYFYPQTIVHIQSHSIVLIFLLFFLQINLL